MDQLPQAPVLGPPTTYFHGVWIGAPEHEAVEWYDELDAERWSIRCVRAFRDGSLKAHSYASPDWRIQMPDQPIPPLEEINANPDFVGREITKAEFDAVWEKAKAQRC
jgi:hypothetical protein